MQGNLKTQDNRNIEEALDVVRCIYDKIIYHNDYFIIAENDNKKYILDYDGRLIQEGLDTEYQVISDNVMAFFGIGKSKGEDSVTILSGSKGTRYTFELKLLKYERDRVFGLSESLVVIKGASETIILNVLDGSCVQYPLRYSSATSAQSNTCRELKYIKSGDLAKVIMRGDWLPVVYAEVKSTGIAAYDKKYVGNYIFTGTRLNSDEMKAYARRCERNKLYERWASSLYAPSGFVRGIHYKLSNEYGHALGNEYCGFELSTRAVNIYNRKYILCYNYEDNSSDIKTYGVIDINGNEIVAPKYQSVLILSDRLAVLQSLEKPEIILVNLDERKVLDVLPLEMCAIHPILNMITVAKYNETTQQYEFIVYDASGSCYPLNDFLGRHKPFMCTKYPNIFKIDVTSLYRLEYAPRLVTFIDNRLNIISNEGKIKELEKADWVEIK